MSIAFGLSDNPAFPILIMSDCEGSTCVTAQAAILMGKQLCDLVEFVEHSEEKEEPQQ